MLHLLTDNGHAFNSEALLPSRLSLPQCWMTSAVTFSSFLFSFERTLCFIDNRSLLTNLTPSLFFVEFDAADALQLDYFSSSYFLGHL